MADDQRPVLQPTFDYVRTRLSRRKVMGMLGVLMLVALVCVAAIGAMLQRLEARNASFHPPMTQSERQLLMPDEPRLDVTPSVDGLRYGSQVDGMSDNGDTLGEGTVAVHGDGQLMLLKGSYSKEPGNHAEDLSHAH
jgi:hypothetical protein